MKDVDAVVPEMPANVHAESVILGAVLAGYCTAPDLLPDDFSLESHRRIYLRISELVTSGSAVDLVTVIEALGKELPEVGGRAYLFSLTEGIPFRPAIADYVEIIKEKAKLRRLLKVCAEATERAYDSKKAVEIGRWLVAEMKALFGNGKK